MKTYSLKTNNEPPVLAKDKNKFLAIQGNTLFFQDEPNGWAAFTNKESLKSYQRAYGGEILEFNK